MGMLGMGTQPEVGVVVDRRGSPDIAVLAVVDIVQGTLAVEDSLCMDCVGCSHLASVGLDSPAQGKVGMELANLDQDIHQFGLDKTNEEKTRIKHQFCILILFIFNFFTNNIPALI